MKIHYTTATYYLTKTICGLFITDVLYTHKKEEVTCKNCLKRLTTVYENDYTLGIGKGVDVISEHYKKRIKKLEKQLKKAEKQIIHMCRITDFSECSKCIFYKEDCKW